MAIIVTLIILFSRNLLCNFKYELRVAKELSDFSQFQAEKKKQLEPNHTSQLQYSIYPL